MRGLVEELRSLAAEGKRKRPSLSTKAVTINRAHAGPPWKRGREALFNYSRCDAIPFWNKLATAPQQADEGAHPGTARKGIAFREYGAPGMAAWFPMSVMKVSQQTGGVIEPDPLLGMRPG